jgi:polyhydroxybutyrate depolymerase
MTVPAGSGRRRHPELLIAVCAILVLAACGVTGHGSGAAKETVTSIGGSRPVRIDAPPSYRHGQAMPLVLLLHGYQSSGAMVERYFDLTPLADRLGFLYAHPDGSTDATGNRFWNASGACCDFENSGVDDSEYLEGVIHQTESQYSVDPNRIYIIGHSNGGIMAYRMACDHAGTIAAIVSLSGGMLGQIAACQPSQPVSVLEIHGTADRVIPYAGRGGTGSRSIPSAPTSVREWASLDGCQLSVTDEPATHIIDLADVQDASSTLTAPETRVSEYRTGCKHHTQAELWTVQGGGHVPGFAKGFGAAVVSFLLSQHK